MGKKLCTELVLTNYVYLNGLRGENWERYLDHKLTRIFGMDNMEKINNICLELTGGHLAVWDLECSNIRMFFLRNKICLDTFRKNLDYLIHMDLLDNLEHTYLDGPKQYFRYLGLINNYIIPDNI